MKTGSTRHPAWRVAALVLVLANVGYFAWSRGVFAVFGLQPSRFTESEPYRMARQVRPEMLRVLKETPSPRPAPESPPLAETPATPEAPAEVQAPVTPSPTSP
ncbi:MAG: hypothetical protein ACRYGA_06435 [Janthinobacterium lividum]